MKLLGEGVDNSWKEEHLTMLAESEGTKGRKKAIEGGGPTRGYGITVIPEALEDIADSLSDKDLASRIIDHNHNKMRAMGIDFDNLPKEMKINASDLMFNTGTLFDNYRTALGQKDYQTALRESLDVISANDPDQDDQSKILRGLVNRRRDMYNYSAKGLNLPQIAESTIYPSTKEGALTEVTYRYESDLEPFVLNINKGMHTKSITDERPQGYDIRPSTDIYPFSEAYKDDPNYKELGYDLTPIVPEGTPSYMNLLGE